MATKVFTPLLSILLMPLLAVEPVMAQSPTAPDVTDEALQIRVMDGDAASAPNGPGPARGLTVQVTDAAGVHVHNAAVIFRLPDSGSSARFADGTLAAVTYTDADGRAHANDIRWGDTPGSVMVRVTAVKGTAHAGLLFEHTLSPAASLVSAAAPRSAPVQVPAPISVPVQTFQPQSTPVSISRPHALASRPAVPGDLPTVSVTNSSDTDDDSVDANVPSRHLPGTANALAEAPEVSISGSGAASGGHSKKKWIAVLAIAAGTGAALALVHKAGTSSSSSSSSGVNIGSPSISVGHP